MACCCQQKCASGTPSDCCSGKSCTTTRFLAVRTAAVVSFGARTWEWPTATKLYCIPFYEAWRDLIDGLVTGTVTLPRVAGENFFRYRSASQTYGGNNYFPLEITLTPRLGFAGNCIPANLPFYDGSPNVECCIQYIFSWTARFVPTEQNCSPCNGFGGNPNGCSPLETGLVGFSNRSDAVIAQGSLCNDGAPLTFLDRSNTLGGSGTAFCCTAGSYTGFVDVSFV